MVTLAGGFEGSRGFGLGGPTCSRQVVPLGGGGEAPEAAPGLQKEYDGM